MSVLIVIPARYESQRFPGKPLTMLRGASGDARSLLQRTHEVARAVAGVATVLVATDDERIANHARGFGADVAMTSASCRNGTERCAEVVRTLDEAPSLVVNLQGDAPLTPPAFVEALIAGIGDAPVATPVLACDATTLRRFKEDRAAGRVGGTTAVMTTRGEALYFSKEVLPYADAASSPRVHHHVGLYAYRPDALLTYAASEPTPLERAEGLEQLRFLEHGVPIRCVEVAAHGRVFWEVNNPIDVARVEQALAELGID